MASEKKQTFRVERDSVTFWLRVKPRSSRERLTVDSSGEPRLELHAAPTEGQANVACIKFLARVLRVTRSSVEIITGEKSRRKLIRIRGGEEIARQIQSLAGIAPTIDLKRLTTDD
jgi:uncharacterized protein (TIGR00251 family)